MIPKGQPGPCRLHNVQFYNAIPRGIVCSAINRTDSKLALARDDGTIELWNVLVTPFLERTIPGGENVSVEGLAWVGSRLFSVGLAGSLVEWELSPHPESKNTMLLTGNAAWCLDVSRDEKLLAVGTDSGYINLFNVENDELNYQKVFDRQEGRIMSCSFDWSGDFLVTGSADAVRVWNVRTGHAIHKMTTGRTERDRETIVWSLLVLKDFTIVSGDSRGRITYYDGHHGTVIDSISVSQVDILSLAINEAENKLFVTGVEPIIRIFDRVEVLRGNERVRVFVRALVRRCHTHDIKTMTTMDKRLFSAGVDGALVVTSYPPHVTDRYLPLLGPPTVAIAEKARMILLRYVNYLEVWTMSSASGPNISTDDSRKILQIRSKNDEHILCCAMSQDGKWIVYSTESIVRLFNFQYHRDTEEASLVRIRNTPDEFGCCYKVEFTRSSSDLFLFKRNGTIDYFTIVNDDSLDHKQTIQTAKWLPEQVHLSAVSNCDRFFICADLTSSIVVFRREPSGKWIRSISLPRYKMPPTAIGIQPNTTRLVAVFPDYKFFLYDFDEFRFVFSVNLRKDVGSANKAIRGIAFDPRNDRAVLLQNDTDGLLLLQRLQDGDTNEKEENDRNVRQSKRTRPQPVEAGSNEQAPKSKYRLTLVRKCERLVHIAWVGEDELIAVEANAMSMLQHSTAAFRRKEYGKT